MIQAYRETQLLLTPASSYLPLCVHLQYVHHIDHDVFVGFLVFPHSEGNSKPAGSTGAHVGPTAILPPLTDLCLIQKILPCVILYYTGYLLILSSLCIMFNSNQSKPEE
ncbi:hypothetical protein AMECASPLE_035698 [Ameca splendens]|uniref:Uncharacterized protein n=1 Tax=Ameca splendens TaxID=208324 RepID=A0ABV1AEY0_9TELE